MVDEIEYTLRPAVDDDEQFLRRLHKECYENVVIEQFGEWDDDVQRGFFDRKWKPENYQIIVSPNADVGAVSVFDRDDHILLAEIVIVPEYQNSGLGSTVVEEIVARARKENRPVRLQVLKANRARELYLRLGFREVVRTETHLIMER